MQRRSDKDEMLRYSPIYKKKKKKRTCMKKNGGMHENKIKSKTSLIRNKQ